MAEFIVSHALDEIIAAAQEGKTLEGEKRRLLLIEIDGENHIQWTAYGIPIEGCPELLARVLAGCFDDLHAHSHPLPAPNYNPE